MFKRLLIANRGEIAVRVIRSAREMGIETVAIFSEADRQALHVRLADHAYCVGPPPARESYLAIAKIVEIGRRTGCEAIHPGYGFLAENPLFAEACLAAGLVFVGPTPSAMRAMGDKTFARRRVRESGVPVVAGMEEPLENAEEARRKARGLGYPILLKAAGGGGGKGMRIVQGEEELEPSFRAAQGEARSAFDDPRIYIEKYLLHPRHIEFQILADRYGNAIHLGERECSIQRRHQKLIEESPSVALDDGLREEMGQAAVAAAKAVDYVNAGTIEFMFVEAERKFYFLEMNTRLQVEHPVTELLTGTDLVKEQILISSGERLSLGQQDVRRRGWAIEFRIYAEDPFNSFLPSTGTVTYLQEPQGPGVRMDSGIYSGCEVSVYYDPLIAKLVVWGENREEALARGRRALQEYRILGLETTIPLHRMIADDQSFRRGSFDTGYLEKTSFQPRSEKRHELAAAIVASLLDRARRRQAGSRAPASSAAGVSPWKLAARKEGLRG